jgi:maltooligosyltrehalose trehalohydrolase
MSEFTVPPLSADCGAFLSSTGECHWRVWAPYSNTVQLVLVDQVGVRSTHEMSPEDQGHFVFTAAGIEEGQRYVFSLNGSREVPDPASRWQPEGVHAPSAVWDPQGFAWSDADWEGVAREALVIYELHVGTFTPQGTFAAIIPRLQSLRELGITAIELMPVGQFPGRRNWGYDGTYWYAAQNSYGGPRELQQLVDACHAAGMAIVLDVIYNHLGPEGNYLQEFGPYFTGHYHTPWGSALNYDDEGCDDVRKFVTNNVRQWVRDFHFDGLRLDAVHAICDGSSQHLLADIKLAANDEAAKLGWPAHIIAESSLNDVRLLRPLEQGGYRLDAQWNDDFHHCVHALLTGESNGYYSDYHSPATQLVKAFNDTFVYDGCHSPFLGRQHGAPVGDLTGDRFVVSVQTHDQVGNRALGERLTHLVDPAKLRLAAALLLLSPHIPMLFMGEEYGEECQFPFFCDFGDLHLQDAVRRGRRAEFPQFAWSDEFPDPQDEQTFLRAKLRWSWPESSSQMGLRRLYQDLLTARRTWPALKDFQHRTARLLTSTEGATVLHLVRGAPTQPSRQLHAYFNLGPIEASGTWEPSTQGPLLSTEAIRYGGRGETTTLGSTLAPFECLVLHPLEGDFCEHDQPRGRS